MTFRTQSVVIFKNTFDYDRMQLPIARQSDGTQIVGIYGDNLDIYDSSGFALTLASKASPLNALFILYYDADGGLINRTGDMQIVGNFREITFQADTALYISMIVETTSTFPIPFYNTEGNVNIFLPESAYSGNEMAVIASYAPPHTLSVSDIGPETQWVWARTAEINFTGAVPAPPYPNPKLITSINLNLITREAISFSVCCAGNLELYSGGVKIVSEVPGSSVMSYFFRETGNLLSARGIFTPESNLDSGGLATRTSFNISSRNFLRNLFAGSVIVNNTNGLFFQAIGINQGIGLPDNYYSTVIYLSNPFSPEAMYSFYFVGFHKDFAAPAAATYDEDSFQSVVNFRENDDLYLTILCKRTDTNSDTAYQIATTGGFIDTITPTNISAGANGYILLRFRINVADDRTLSLTNVYSFVGDAAATVSLNNIGIVSKLAPNKKVAGAIILEMNGISSINRFDVASDFSLTQLSSLELPTSKNQVVWLGYIENEIVLSYHAFVANNFVGQSTEKDIVNDTIAVIYSDNTATDTVQIDATTFEESVFNFNETTPGMYGIVTIDAGLPTSPWTGWSIMLVVLGSFCIALVTIVMLSNLYDNIREAYGKKFKEL